MSKVKILDCTLRDGGYVNNFNFGKKTIKKIVNKLSKANIDIIECGFLKEYKFNEDMSIFDCVDKIKYYIGDKNENLMYVAMIAQPYIDINSVKDNDGNSIDGIRLTFHEDEIDEAIEYAKKLMEKKYKVFIQPVGTTTYSDENLLKLIKKVNNIKPYAFYLVDTLGSMYKNDLLRLFYIVDNNLDEDIRLGFHSHNNLQLSFSNAQELSMIQTKREIIIDSSVYGMGRGAGNLCTELLAQYINDNIEYSYNIVPLLEIMDNHLNSIYNQYKWGYSVPYYIASVNDCHPNYASYLMNKQTISIKEISDILKFIECKKRHLYDEEYIEKIYLEYQSNVVDDLNALKDIKQAIGERDVLVIAPGKSIEQEKEKINKFIEDNDVFVININFKSEQYNSDAIFISNLKRFNGMEDIIEPRGNTEKIIVTSNIIDENNTNDYKIVNYADLLVEDKIISDNAGLMLINLLKKLNVKNIYLAGFDGFSLSKENNYFNDEMINNINNKDIMIKNDAIKRQLQIICNYLNVTFLTPSLYQIYTDYYISKIGGE